MMTMTRTQESTALENSAPTTGVALDEVAARVVCDRFFSEAAYC